MSTYEARKGTIFTDRLRVPVTCHPLREKLKLPKLVSVFGRTSGDSTPLEGMGVKVAFGRTGDSTPHLLHASQ